MTCQEFLASYSEYLDELLEPTEAARVQQHMARCASCARYDRVVREGLDLFRGLPRIEPSEEFEPRLQHRLFHVRDERADERASGASAVVALAIAGMLAAIAWSPLFRADPFTVDLPATGARAPGETPRVAAPAPFTLPAAWPEDVVARDGAQADDATPWWWTLPEPAGTGPVFDFAYGSFQYTPGPHSPLIVDRPDFGPAQPRVLGTAASGGALGRE